MFERGPDGEREGLRRLIQFWNGMWKGFWMYIHIQYMETAVHNCIYNPSPMDDNGKNNHLEQRMGLGVKC